eukprot:228168_1
MASLAEVIRFRVFTNKLNDTEFNDFMVAFVQKCGRNVITTSLFAMFLSNEHDSTKQTLNESVSIIKQIIETRKSKPIIPHQTAMQSLPSALIGNLASYLDCTDHIAFSKVNRMIYIGCNSPNTLQRLRLLKRDDYSTINVAKYSQLKSLSVKLKAFDSFVLPSNGATVFNRLQRLLLDGDKQSDVSISHLNTLNVNNIKHLVCQNLGDESNDEISVSCNAFTDLLSKFQNIERLSLSGVSFDPHVDNKLNPQMLPHLKTFLWASNGSPAFLVQMLQIFGSKLESLSLWDNVVFPLPSHISFSNLQHLNIAFRITSTLNHILKTATKLREIVLTFRGTIGRAFPIQVFMEQLFLTQPFIEYIEFADIPYDIFSDFCNVTGQALNNTKQKINKNTNFKFKLSIHPGTAIDTAKYENILLVIDNILKQLPTVNMESFLLFVSFKKDDKSDWSKQLMVFKEKHSDLYIVGGHPKVKARYDHAIVATTNASFRLNTCTYA